MSNEPPFSLDAIDTELDDAEIVLACLDRVEPGMCEVCSQAAADGTLEERPVLKTCADARSQTAPG